MMLSFITVLCFVLTSLQPDQASASVRAPQDRSRETGDLLKELVPGTLPHHEDVWMGPASPKTIDRVRGKLVQIANESSESRDTVIAALVVVLNDPPRGEFDLDKVDRWRFAVALLGELKATEAIDDLVRNINCTSYNGWPRIYPVRSALIRIGQSAVPRLLTALSDEYIHREASEALAGIGEPSVDGLLDLLRGAGPFSRAGAADTLALIGSSRARNAVETALRLETDDDVMKHIKSAIGYMDHVECLRDSSKCK